MLPCCVCSVHVYSHALRIMRMSACCMHCMVMPKRSKAGNMPATTHRVGLQLEDCDLLL